MSLGIRFAALRLRLEKAFDPNRKVKTRRDRRPGKSKARKLANQGKHREAIEYLQSKPPGPMSRGRRGGSWVADMRYVLEEMGEDPEKWEDYAYSKPDGSPWTADEAPQASIKWGDSEAGQPAPSDAVHPDVVQPGPESQAAPSSTEATGAGEPSSVKGGEAQAADGGPDGTAPEGEGTGESPSPGGPEPSAGSGGSLRDSWVRRGHVRRSKGGKVTLVAPHVVRPDQPSRPQAGQGGEAAGHSEQGNTPARAPQTHGASGHVATPGHDGKGSGDAAGTAEASSSLGERWSQRGRDAKSPDAGPRKPSPSGLSLRSLWNRITGKGGDSQPAPTETKPVASEAPPEVSAEERYRKAQEDAAAAQLELEGTEAAVRRSQSERRARLAAEKLERQALETRLEGYKKLAMEQYHDAEDAGDHKAVETANRLGYAGWVRKYIVETHGEAEATKYDDLLRDPV